MLYHAYEWAHAAAFPLRAAAAAMERTLSNPMNPLSYTTAGRAGAAACSVFEAVTRRYEKPQWLINSTAFPGGQKSTVTIKNVWEKPFCRLLHFARTGSSKRRDPKVLIVAPMSGHYATLLSGTVKAMLPEHEVYITDWADARTVPLEAGRFGYADYIDYVMEMIRHIGPDVHVMAVCQPGPPVLAATAIMSEADDPCVPKSMILMGSPIDPRESPTVPNKIASQHPLEWFEQNAVDIVPYHYPGVGRAVYPGHYQLAGFMYMNLDKHYSAHVKLYENLVKGDGESTDKHRKFYDEYLSVMDLSADFYLETIDTVFQECSLPRGIMTHHGYKVKPSAIKKTALLTIEGEKDDISGVGQTKAALTLCKNIPDDRKENYLQKDVGHYGVFNGSRWRNDIQPRIAAFIRKHG